MKGCVRILNYKNAPVYVHWSILLIVLFYLNKPDPIVGIPLGALGLFIILFVHEIGHAVFIHLHGYKVTHIVFYAINGECYYEYDQNHSKKLMVYAGGVIFQLILALFWYGIMLLRHKLEIHSYERIFSVFTHSFLFMNLLIVIVNLMPQKGLDGYEILHILKNKMRKTGD